MGQVECFLFNQLGSCVCVYDACMAMLMLDTLDLEINKERDVLNAFCVL
jgi:hypothetical protein